MGDVARLGAVADFARDLATARTGLEAATAAARAGLRALDGCHASVSVWEHRWLRVWVGLRVGEEARFPEDERYPAGRSGPVVRFLGRPWSGPERPGAWLETPATGHRPGVRSEGYRRGAVAGPPTVDATSWVVAPVVVRGRVWGELCVARTGDRPVFERRAVEVAAVLAAVLATGIDQQERFDEVRRLAFTDPLTGLANRRSVDLRMAEALAAYRAEGAVVSLVVCDVNGLKRVNDAHGHEAGDWLLEQFAEELSRCAAMLPDALVARLGGDEFCLLAVGPSADEVVRVADELCRRGAELELGEGIACGLASTGDPIGGVHSARRLFRLADAAQYQAKASGSGKPVVAGRDGAVVSMADRAERVPPGSPPLTSGRRPSSSEPGERRHFRRG
ncbi:GGDEF domain-containing protein [Streptomyces sp. NPDC005438]|uniref:GGDEF domain-containing protein n=1 Tax=Streptomyces sp. NPDC005438 TaxID=3156880 RepID=UPI0033A7AEC4